MAMLLVASWGDLRSKGALLAAAAAGFGLFIVAIALSPWFAFSLVVVMSVGELGSAYDTSMSTVLITAAGDDVRGRMLGLYYAMMGVSAFGWLGIGAVAAFLGAPVALALSGSIVALGALGLLSRRQGLSRPGAAIAGPE